MWATPFADSAARHAPSTSDRDLAGAGHLLVEDADILVQRDEIDLLLVVRPEQVVVGLAGYREHRRAIHLRVIQTVEQVNCPRSGRREAHAELAGVLRVAARHERRRFLVPDLDERDAVLVRAECFHESVDAVSGQTEDDAHAPVDQAADEEVRSSWFCHAAIGCKAQATATAGARESTRCFR